MHTWAIRNPDGGASGIEFARGRLDPHDTVLAHALPERIDVEVIDADGARVAHAEGLEHDAETPMSRLRMRDGTVERENIWPTDDDLGVPVILCGGEVGILVEWWHAPDHSEWRWRIELYNRR